MGWTLVSWSSKKQNTVARSSTKSKYRAIATSVQELEWVQSIVYKLVKSLSLSLALILDNQGAIFLASNPTSHSRLKHVAIDLHFVREHVENGSGPHAYSRLSAVGGHFCQLEINSMSILQYNNNNSVDNKLVVG